MRAIARMAFFVPVPGIIPKTHDIRYKNARSGDQAYSFFDSDFVGRVTSPGGYG